MCELFGFTSAEPTDINSLLTEFFSHSSSNPHGWGMLYGDKVVKGCERASDSNILSSILKKLGPQQSVLGHIRFATIGSIKIENCHPFTDRDITGRQWTLIHNGTIYSGSRLIPYIQTQTGDTDSERLFKYIMETLNIAQKNEGLSAEQRCVLIDGILRELAPRNKLNIMIHDGELLYIHKNMQDTMKYRRVGDGYVFSTTALDSGEWKNVPIAQLLVYKDGRKIYNGTQHGGIFVATLQYIKAMDAMHI